MPVGKEPEVDRVCPLCHTFGKNINLIDFKNPKTTKNYILATCLACKGVYHIEDNNAET